MRATAPRPPLPSPDLVQTYRRLDFRTMDLDELTATIAELDEVAANLDELSLREGRPPPAQLEESRGSGTLLRGLAPHLARPAPRWRSAASRELRT
jgi:hypothetical protein